MAVIAAAAIGAGASILSGVFGSRSNAKAQKEAEKRNFRYQNYFNQQARQDALADRRYREEAIGSYRPYGTPGTTSPGYTDPGQIQVIDPLTKTAVPYARTPGAAPAPAGLMR